MCLVLFFTSFYRYTELPGSYRYMFILRLSTVLLSPPSAEERLKYTISLNNEYRECLIARLHILTPLKAGSDFISNC